MTAANWRDRAGCRRLDGRDGRPDFTTLPYPTQRAMCHACPVRWACLEEALEVEKDFQWKAVVESVTFGGLTGKMRARILRGQRENRENRETAA